MTLEPLSPLSQTAIRAGHLLRSPTFIVAVAFVIRIAALGLTYSYYFPSREFGAEIGHVAQSIAAGKGLSSPYEFETGPTALVPPVYPYLVAGLFRVFGSYSLASALLILTFSSICSAFTCWTIFIIGLRTFGKAVAIGAAWTWAFSPFAIQASVGYVWETALTTLLFSVAFVLTLCLQEHKSMKAWTVYGLLWGGIILTNPAIVAVLPGLLVWILFRQRSWGNNCIRQACVGVLICVLCVTPWLVRNYLVFGHFVFVRSGFPMELYRGTQTEQRGARQWAYSIPSSERRLYSQIGELAYMAQRKRDALSAIERSPGQYVWSSLERCVFFWTGNWAYFSMYKEMAGLTTRQVAFKFVLDILLSVVTFIGLGLAFWNRELYARLLSVPLIFYPVVYYITRVETRFRHPIEPYMVILGVYAVVHTTAWFGLVLRSRSLRRPLGQAK